MTKRQVPETRIKATADRVFPAVDRATVRAICIAFAEDLAQHPIVPTDEQLNEILPKLSDRNVQLRHLCIEWQRRMFLAEPEIPEEVKDLADRLFSNGAGQEAERLVLTSSRGDNLGGWCKKAVIDQIIEAFRRGQRSKGSV